MGGPENDHSGFFLGHRARVWLTVASGLLLSLAAAFLAGSWQRAEQENQFLYLAQNQAALVQNALQRKLEVIRSVADLYAASEEVNRAEFRAFTSGPLAEHPEIRALEWVPRITADSLEHHIASARVEGFPEFTIKELNPQGQSVPVAKRPEYYPVYFVEPLAGNETDLGYDLASDEHLRRAMERARDSGNMFTSEPISLDPDGEKQISFLVFQPVYRSGWPTDTLEQRRKNLEGFAVGVFQITESLTSALANERTDIDVAMLDRDASAGKELLYFHPAHQATGVPQDKWPGNQSHLQWLHPLNLPGRNWSLMLTPSNDYQAHLALWWAWSLLGAGLAITTAVWAYLVAGERRRTKLAELAARLHDTGADLADARAGRDQAERQMEKLATALEKTTDSVIITDDKGVIEYVNPAFQTITGFSRDEVQGKTPNFLADPEQDIAFAENLRSTITGGEAYRNVHNNRKKDGSMFYQEITITPIRSWTGEVTNFVLVGRDMTARQQTMERLHQLAYYDLVTGLPNRALFMERLNHALVQRRSEDSRLAVLFIDLDRFKQINDTLGHDFGDALLRQIPTRILGSLRKGDTLARLGGDEFALLAETVSEEDVAKLAAKIVDGLHAPFTIRGHEMYVTASVGISIYPRDGSDATSLLKHADVAMYRAKDLDRNNFQFYSSELGDKALEQMVVNRSLHRALHNDQLALNYQALLHTGSGKLAGIETLLRWRHPELGLVTPSQFMPLLEKSGLTIQVNAWVLKNACAQLADWRRRLGLDTRISVNLSPRQLQDQGLRELVSNALHETGLPPSALLLEVTEGMVMGDDSTSLDNLRALHATGVRVALDDFGTGYSSLSHLRYLPLDMLKIDRSFVHDLPGDRNATAIVNSILGLAEGLELEVTAEGVENERQLQFLTEAGCDYLQGFLLSKPMTADQMTEYLRGFQPPVVLVRS